MNILRRKEIISYIAMDVTRKDQRGNEMKYGEKNCGEDCKLCARWEMNIEKGPVIDLSTYADTAIRKQLEYVEDHIRKSIDRSVREIHAKWFVDGYLKDNPMFVSGSEITLFTYYGVSLKQVLLKNFGLEEKKNECE